jgi:hypothetical protein
LVIRFDGNWNLRKNLYYDFLEFNIKWNFLREKNYWTKYIWLFLIFQEKTSVFNDAYGLKKVKVFEHIIECSFLLFIIPQSNWIDKSYIIFPHHYYIHKKIWKKFIKQNKRYMIIISLPFKLYRSGKKTSNFCSIISNHKFRIFVNKIGILL